MAMVMVAHAARSPNADSSEDKRLTTLRMRVPNRCQAVVGGRCSGSFLRPYPSPRKTMLALSRSSGEDSAVASELDREVTNHLRRRRRVGMMRRFLDMVPSATLRSAKATRSWTAWPEECMRFSM